MTERKSLKVSGQTYEYLSTIQQFLTDLFGKPVSMDEVLMAMIYLKINMADMGLIPTPGMLMNEKERHSLERNHDAHSR